MKVEVDEYMDIERRETVKAGALYRIDGYVLINREIFDAYLERFHLKQGLAERGFEDVKVQVTEI